MNFEIGKVIKYKNKEGLIISLSGITYLFLKTDLKNSIRVNDLVIFRPEEIEHVKRAFFVRELQKYLRDNEEFKIYLSEYFDDIKK